MNGLETMSTTNRHSRFAPSKMHRRIACPGSAHIDNRDEPSKYADEGTLAHNFAANILLGKSFLSEKISDEMKEAVKIYVDYINSYNEDTNIETKVTINSISDEISGTTDCIILDEWLSILHVIDLKYGAGKIVEPHDNAQLITYALGALETYSDEWDKIWITIVQPRIEHKNGPIRVWETTPKELKKIWHPKIKKAYETAIAKPNLFKPGDHCVWCSGAFQCPRAKKQTKAIEKASNKNEIVTADNKKLAKLLLSEQMVLEYFSKAKLEAFNRLRGTQKIPGFKLVRNFGNITWKSKAEAEYMFRTVCDAWERKLFAPGKLKKLYPEKVDALTHQLDRGLILVSESDKREEYKGAASDFEEEFK